jgi:copper transport protein
VTRRARIGLAAAAAVLALALPAAAAAHAYLVKTSPVASELLTESPTSVQLTFDEAVEPRFAIISVTDVDAHPQTTGPVERSPADPNTLVVPVKTLPEGWYLVYWRAISVDGHPVQGAFTFAVGPNAGPAPQFVIPHIAATATSPRLVVAKWIAFLAMMSAIGLFVLRILIARPLVRRVEGTSLHAVSIAFMAAAAVALIAIPVYLEESASIDSLRSFFAFGALVPLWRTTANGRGYVDLELCFALFTAAALVTIWVDKPERPIRSVAALVAAAGALLGAGATLLLPGTVGHAGQTSPRGLTVALDWVHLVSGSVWVGGLIGVLVLWWTLGSARLAGLRVVVPRFSNVAFFSVLLLLATGTAEAILHLPVLDALWLTTYGKVILVKAGILLVAMVLAAFNLLRTRPGLASDHAGGSARLLRGLVAGETLLVAGAIFAASILSSLAPPPPSFAEQGKAQAKVGPGKVAETVQANGYTVQALVDPNKAAAPNDFALKVTRNGQPVTGADVTLTFEMLDMLMPNQEYALKETSPGVYSHTSPALVMVGHWGLTYTITPPGGQPFTVTIVDHASG